MTTTPKQRQRAWVIAQKRKERKKALYQAPRATIANMPGLTTTRRNPNA